MSHFKSEVTKAQRGDTIYLSSHSKGPSWDLNPGHLSHTIMPLHTFNS